jgi:large subunit ribosomal protein L24
MAGRAAAARSPKVPEIRKGDTVVVLAGKDVGKRGVVDQVVRRVASPSGSRSVFRRNSPAGGIKVVIEGVNIAKRHTKPRQSQGTNERTPKILQGGILEIAQPLPISRVMLVCPNCSKPTRIAHATLDTGRRVRLCRHCGQQLEVKA